MKQNFSENVDNYISDINYEIKNDFPLNDIKNLKLLYKIKNVNNLTFLVMKDQTGKEIFNYNFKGTAFLPYDISYGKVSGNDTIYTVVNPIYNDKLKLGVVYVGFSLQKFYQVVKSYRWNTALICLVVFLMGMFAVFLSNRIISVPLKNLASLEKEIEKNKYLNDKSFISASDIGELSSIFKKTVENLEKAYGEVENVNR